MSSPPFRRSDQIAVALLFLTRLPWSSPPDWPPDGLVRSIWAFPVAGAVIGAILGLGACGAASLGISAPVAAWLTLGLGLLITGGLHEDGLADCADGLGGGRDRAQKLAIMRDSRIGAYGVLALLVTVGLRVAALESLIGAPGAVLILSLLAGAMVSRAVMALPIAILVSARSDGLGAGLGRPRFRDLALGGGLASLPVGGLMVLGHPGHAVMAGLCAAIGGLFMARLARRMIGGYTGDVLGAVQMVAETVFMVIMSTR